MKKIIAAFILLGFILQLANCSEGNSKSAKTILHPNKDSELTLLMREMYDYYDEVKVDIQNNQKPTKIRNFLEMHSAVATEPSKSESALYKAMTTVYLESAKRLNTTTPDLPKVFNEMVDNCMNCHKQMCPGPMVKIKKLYI